MDLEQLTEDIRSAYPHDPVSSAQLPTPSAPKWSLSEDGMLLLNERLYIPDHDDLRLQVLWYKHDHPLAGHYGQNKTIELIRRDYAWPGMRVLEIQGKRADWLDNGDLRSRTYIFAFICICVLRPCIYILAHR